MYAKIIFGYHDKSNFQASSSVISLDKWQIQVCDTKKIGTNYVAIKHPQFI